MTEKCFDEGTIQAFLDGELGLDLVDRVSRHVALCDSCAMAVAETEGEMEFLFTALDNEFNTLVPTERLWKKINNSIECEAKNKSIWQSVFAFLTNPSSLAFASLLIVLGLFIGLYGLKNGSALKNSDVARNSPKPVTRVQNVDITSLPDISTNNSSNASMENDEPKVTARPRFVDVKTEDESEFKVRTADFKPERTVRRIPKVKPETYSPDVVYVDETLAAEESYVKTISTLEKTVNNRKDEVLRPSARFGFEKDMAVADDTISKLKDEVRKNPKNEAARILLRNSYQNKINLLNSVAEKNDLMASLN